MVSEHGDRAYPTAKHVEVLEKVEYNIENRGSLLQISNKEPQQYTPADGITHIDPILCNELIIRDNNPNRPRRAGIVGYAEFGSSVIAPRRKSWRMELNHYYLIRSCSIGGIDREYKVRYAGNFGHSDDYMGAIFILDSGENLWCSNDEYSIIEEISKECFEGQY